MRLPRETIQWGERSASGRTQRNNHVVGKNKVVEKFVKGTERWWQKLEESQSALGFPLLC